MTELVLVGVLGLGWLLMLAQPLFVAKESRSYLRSIGQFQRSLAALGAGLQPPRRQRPTRELALRRQRALLGLVASVAIGGVLVVLSVPLGLTLVTLSLIALVAFLRLCTLHPIWAPAPRPVTANPKASDGVGEHRAIA